MHHPLSTMYCDFMMLPDLHSLMLDIFSTHLLLKYYDTIISAYQYILLYGKHIEKRITSSMI